MAKKHAYEVEPGQWVELTPGKQVRLFGVKEHKKWNKEEGRYDITPELYERIFQKGDTVEYDSYNLRYTGPIVSIGAKTITVQKFDGSRTRMKPKQFNWRNWNFDAEEVARQNAETMMHI